VKKIPVIDGILSEEIWNDFYPETNFNIWVLDDDFERWFALGSYLALLYRNQLFKTERNQVGLFRKLVQSLQSNRVVTFSLRINDLIDLTQTKEK